MPLVRALEQAKVTINNITYVYTNIIEEFANIDQLIAFIETEGGGALP